MLLKNISVACFLFNWGYRRVSANVNLIIIQKIPFKMFFHKIKFVLWNHCYRFNNPSKSIEKNKIWKLWTNLDGIFVSISTACVWHINNKSWRSKDSGRWQWQVLIIQYMLDNMIRLLAHLLIGLSGLGNGLKIVNMLHGNFRQGQTRIYFT